MVKSKKNESEDGSKKAHSASNRLAGGGKVRRRNEMANKSPPASGMMQCYENALHTNSVTLRHISFVESALDKHISEEPGSKEFLKVKKGKLKKLRKQTKAVVITRTNIGDVVGQHEPKKRFSPDAVMIQAIYAKPLLVLDLNGILCRRIRYNKLSFKDGERINFRPSVGHIAGTPVVAREDLQPMLSYLDAHFTLAVWTSAKLATARGLIAMLFPPDIANRLLFVWGQDRCDATRPDDADGTGIKGKNNVEDGASDEPDTVGDAVGGKSNTKDNFDIIFEKSLGKVWGMYPIWDATNSILVDDSPEKARKWIENTLHPPPIDGIMASKPGGKSADLSNAIKQRIFFEKLVELFSQRRIDDSSESIELLCSNMVVESTDNRRERRKRECKELHSVLANDDHMGWRGDADK